MTLFERAERAGGHDGSGWILYRMVKDDAVSEGIRGQRPHESPAEE